MIFIRTDMNEKIATGHVMRCLSIADALKEQGEEVHFLLADEQAQNLIQSRGYESIVLHTVWNDMDSEIPVLLAAIDRYKITRILIDSYQVTLKYLTEIKKMVQIMYIDDLKLFCYPVDVIVCYANYWSRFYSRQNDPSTIFLLGTKYVPLRKVFWNCERKKITKEAGRLLLLSGGTDPYDFLGQTLMLLDLRVFQHIDVICGRYYPNYEELCGKYEKNSKISIHKSIPDIEKYMKNADIAISAGGTTLYELCACGTPTISYSFADNQLDNVKQFASDGLTDYAGDLRYENVPKKVIKLIEQYQKNLELRKQRSQEMQKLVDGKGAIRLAQKLVEL